ncbi:MAG TPA: hypothetical protein VKH83_12575 [Methylomirabilota bacterium]|nr:hypothetical protein [Methylomirabilota bacterium]
MRCFVGLGRIVAVLAVTLALTACAPVGASSSSSPSMRCMDEPGRGSTGETRPLFFVLCAQSP